MELWIRTVARGMDVAPGPYIKEQLSYPSDIVDHTQEYLDDTYVESLENKSASRNRRFGS